ncbi:MAG: hypothetical protein C0407_15405 [Desulfobacca sp.]|nr:hypothetical protein [Desulfobacca sp.]
MARLPKGSLLLGRHSRPYRGATPPKAGHGGLIVPFSGNFVKKKFFSSNTNSIPARFINRLLKLGTAPKGWE